MLLTVYSGHIVRQVNKKLVEVLFFFFSILFLKLNYSPAWGAGVGWGWGNVCFKSHISY